MDFNISTTKNELYQLSLKMLELRKHILDRIHTKSTKGLPIIEQEYKKLFDIKTQIITQLKKQKKNSPRKSISSTTINFNKMLHTIK